MKFFPFLLLSVFALPSWADTDGFFHSPPTGFVRADRLFPLDLTELDNEFGLNTIIFAKYIPAKDLPIREQNNQAIPSWYIHIAYDGKYSRYPLNRIIFGMVAHIVDKTLTAQYNKPEFLRKLENVVGSVLQRKLVINAMSRQDVIKNTPGLYSILAYGHGQAESGGTTENFMLASMTTFYLAQGRFITLVQGSRISSKDDLPAFTQRAIKIAAEIATR